MKPVVTLDSTPLGLIIQPRDGGDAEACRKWLKRVLASGSRIIVPEIVNYELRRELLRMGRSTAITDLAAFNAASADRYLPLTTQAMDLAAELWAKVRRQGKPTSDPHALDVDMILAAQVLAAGFDAADFVIATSNISHLSLVAPAELWKNI
ncbi:MAG TPA: PIN domain-containing protein [Tepidisphaeraceae bacterium]|jgi:predicted nucleic acid-binding protein|nr:PIN domain-containing protein [Tepidisphaeraceae bacterium]